MDAHDRMPLAQAAQPVEAAKGDDVAFDYPAMTRTPNTFQVHRLMRLAQRRGLATQIAHAIFSAYSEQGRDIGDIGTPTEIAAGIGLDRAEVTAFFASDEDVSDVRVAEQAQQAAGVCSVPAFDIDGEMISGAQSVTTFEAALRRAVDRGEACTNGACAIAWFLAQPLAKEGATVMGSIAPSQHIGFARLFRPSAGPFCTPRRCQPHRVGIFDEVTISRRAHASFETGLSRVH
jgi:DSBA-like thioredoxin domain